MSEIQSLRWSTLSHCNTCISHYSPLLLLLHDLSGVLLIDSLYEGNVVHVSSIRVLKLTHYQLQSERKRERERERERVNAGGTLQWTPTSMADIYNIVDNYENLNCPSTHFNTQPLKSCHSATLLKLHACTFNCIQTIFNYPNLVDIHQSLSSDCPPLLHWS